MDTGNRFQLVHPFVRVQVVYKNNDIRLELSRLARIVDPKMKIQGEVSYRCENVATLDPISFETPEAFISLPKWNTKRMGSISFDFRTTEPNGLILFTHGKPQERKESAKSQKITKVPSDRSGVGGGGSRHNLIRQFVLDIPERECRFIFVPSSSSSSFLIFFDNNKVS